ncbi:MAG: DUF3048 domain-containing protein [Patescibacteria group bacterium]
MTSKEQVKQNRLGVFGESVGSIFKKLKANKKALVAVIIIGIFLITGGAYGFYQYVKVYKKSFKISSGPYIEGREKPKMAPRRLDGVLVKREEANRFPYAVMIENLVDVRPQKGLSRASVVYELLAEGGITRFLAVFSPGEKIKEIWPVRSARHYYLEISSEYNALYVHVGGSPQAYEMISNLKLPVLNEMSADAVYFWRGPEGMPHNLYTSSDLIEKAIADKKYQEKMPPKYEMWRFKDEAKKDARPQEEKTIKIGFAGDYYVEFKYNRDSNSYLRFNGGPAHNDRLTGKQLAPKNVVIQRVPAEVNLWEKDRIDLDLTGLGEVFVFRDGEKIEGQWRKKDRLSRTKFFDKNGREISLNRGQSWVVIVPGERKVEY